jgi:glycosyltransferase involved in cell wall biosynthesis
MSSQKQTQPALSVVMPVHNALPHLDHAIQSITSQTFADFEFVILNDASTDGSTERLHHWASLDERIRLLEVDENLGPVGSSNMVARAAHAPFVARMDADDISQRQRLELEISILRQHADVGVVASVSDIIDSHGRKLRDAEVWRLSRRSVFVPFAHGAMMYRRELFDQVGGYREECEYWEDQDLVVRMAAIAKVAIIPRSLYQVRQSTTSTRVVSNQERLERAIDRAYRATDRLTVRKAYEDVLDQPEAASRKIDPRVFIAIGSVRLWAGDRPRLFLRLLRRARLSFDARTASAMIWTAWASASPTTLRAFLKLLLTARNRLASAPSSTAGALQWQPLADAEPLEPDEASS